MNYHNILYDDMRNGDGLRVVLFVSGCDHRCFNCQNLKLGMKNQGYCLMIQLNRKLYSNFLMIIYQA